MTDAIVSLTRLWVDRVEVSIRRGPELLRYEMAEVPTPVAAVLEFDSRFHHDFTDDQDSRMQILSVVRRVFRGEEIPLPVSLSGRQDRPPTYPIGRT